MWWALIPVWKKIFITFFFFSKLSQCKFKQIETILKLGNTQKQVKIHQIKNRLGCFHHHTNTKALHWNHWGPSDSRPNFLSIYNSKISPLSKFVVKTLRDRETWMWFHSVWINIWMYLIIRKKCVLYYKPCRQIRSSRNSVDSPKIDGVNFSLSKSLIIIISYWFQSLSSS